MHLDQTFGSMCDITVVQWSECGCAIRQEAQKCPLDPPDPYTCPNVNWVDEPKKETGHCGCKAQTPDSSSASDG